MNHTVIDANEVRGKSFPIPELTGNLSPTQANLITEDLGTFLVAHHILISGVDSVSAIKAYFKRTPGMEDLVDDLLLQLESCELISVVGDKIFVQEKSIELGGDVRNLQKFLPRLFKLATDRVLEDASIGILRAKKEGVQYFVLTNDPQTSTEAHAIFMEYIGKLKNLAKKSEDAGRKSDGVRLVGILNCALNPEDFQ